MDSPNFTDNKFFSALKDYKETYGTVNVPKRCKHNPELSLWVENVRRGRHKLSPNQLTQLKEWDFLWQDAHFKKFDRQWDTMLDQLKCYIRTNGHCLVSTAVGSVDDPKLAVWVKNQRANYKKGLLLEERRIKLEAVDFVWVVQEKDGPAVANPTLEERWEKRYDELIRFREQHGHCLVPYRCPPHSTKLGDWCHNQRTSYSRGLLRPDREELLINIGFDFRPDPAHKNK
jgi:hypothetical protein